MFLPNLLCHSYHKLHRRLCCLLGTHHTCSIVQNTRITNGLGFMPRVQKTALPSSISPRSSTTINFLYADSNSHWHVPHGYTSFHPDRRNTGMFLNFSATFMATLYLDSDRILFSLLLFLQAVIRFVFMYAKIAATNESGEHLRIFQSLFHWPIRYSCFSFR